MVSVQYGRYWHFYCKRIGTFSEELSTAEHPFDWYERVLIETETFNLSKIEFRFIEGHSLGAHIVGAAGRNFNYKTDKLVPRITGLDPANPCEI